MPTQRKKNKKARRRGAKALKNNKLSAGEWFEKLVAVQARLRAPNGCPWDREQTHATLRTYLIEEAYEVLDALDSTDDAKFSEELGDLLLQVLFHAQIAREERRFDIKDVIHAIHNKMVRRHPHVFGTTSAKAPADVLRNWEIIKKEERAAVQQTSRKDKGSRSLSSGIPSDKQKASAAKESDSILDGVPKNIPALLEANQLTRKAARIGFDWHNLEGIFAKPTEETHELQAVLAAKPSDPSRVEGELGDILFVAV